MRGIVRSQSGAACARYQARDQHSTEPPTVALEIVRALGVSRHLSAVGGMELHEAQLLGDLSHFVPADHPLQFGGSCAKMKAIFRASSNSDANMRPSAQGFARRCANVRFQVEGGHRFLCLAMSQKCHLRTYDRG